MVLSYRVVIGGALCVLALAIGLVVTEHSIREEMRSASLTKRNKAFKDYLARQGRDCNVIASEFGGSAVHDQFKGDVWSLRCEDKSSYALLLGDDPSDMPWFVACGEAARISNFRCFERNVPPARFR